MKINYVEYGENRLCDLLTGCAENNAQELIEIVTADVNVFTKGAEQSDDITLLALQLSKSC
jgi:sigma-B regulation protein RsbU (phosphoserine phosphatase)